MFISVRETTVPADAQGAFTTLLQERYGAMRPSAGFRWAMLARSLTEPEKLVSITMWQSPQQAEGAIDEFAIAPPDGPTFGPGPSAGYDVVTARGSMTPATFVALVHWEPPDASRDEFVNKWNAAFHAIEDRLGSRLLRNLRREGDYAGIHVAQREDDLKIETLTPEVVPGVKTSGYERYAVVQLVEA